MNPLMPEEQHLHAYVDGQLDAQQRQWVEQYLANHPESAARVTTWQQDNQRLRLALTQFETPLLTPAQRIRHVRQQQGQRRRQHLALAFSLVFTLSLGAMGGWQYATLQGQFHNLPMEDAVQAYKLFGEDKLSALDVAARSPAQLDNWLSRYFINSNTPPNFENYGFTLVGGRLLSTEQGPSALIVYQDAQGTRVTYYIRPAGQKSLPQGQRQADNLMTQYWGDGRYNYAVISPAGNNQTEPLQRKVADYSQRDRI